MDGLFEYKISYGHPTDVEKELNAWRKRYGLKILNVVPISKYAIAIVLIRTKKERCKGAKT